MRFQQFNAIMDNHTLTSNQKSLLLAIYRFINHESGLAYPSIETLMKTSGIKSKSTFLKVRSELVEQELIQYNQHGNKCLYQLTLKNCTSQKSDWYNNSNQVVQNLSQTGTELDHKKKNKTKNEPININNRPVQSGSKVDQTLLDLIHSKENPYYDYINGGWMYMELSKELATPFIC